MSRIDEEVLEKSFDYAEQALERLKEVAELESERADIRRDATIQRFEIAYERLWKLFRKVHMLRGVEAVRVRRPFESFLEAGAAGWLKRRELWEQMVQDRNFISHEYGEEKADEIYRRIVADYLPEMRGAFEYVKKHYAGGTPFKEWKDRA